MKQEIKKRVAGFAQRLFLIAVFVFTALGAWATRLTIDGITYELNNEDYTATVCTSSSSVKIATILETITSDDIEYKVTTIGRRAFYERNSLTDVTIPNSVTVIGEQAFCICKNLINVTIGNSVTIIDGGAFSGCDNLTDVTMGNSVATIGGSAFYDCRNLTNIIIPNSVTTIGVSAFCGCSSMTEVIIPNSVTVIDEQVFCNCSGLTNITIGNEVTTIGAGAFSGCGNLTSLMIPNSVTIIGYGAFRNCSKLTNIIIPDSVTAIESYVFSGCSSLENIALPESLTKIDYLSFEGCTSLASITIPKSVKSFRQTSFGGCSNLKEIRYNAIDCEFVKDGSYRYKLKSVEKVVIGEDVEVLPERPFLLDTSLKELYYNAVNCTYINYNDHTKPEYQSRCFPSSLEKVTIGEKVEKIPTYLFYRCGLIKDITIPESVISIGKNAFADCSGLSEVMAPSIESWLKIKFENDKANPTYYAKKLICNGSSIRKLMIPEGEKRINAYAFVNCEPLITVNVPVGFEGIGTLAFKGCSGQQRFIFESLADFLSINYDDEKSRFTEGNSGKIYIKNQAFDATNIGEMTLPEGMKFIPDYAFYGYGITGITIPADLEWIGKYAFADTKLASIKCEGESERSFVLPDKISEVKEGCFRKTHLTKVSFGSTVTAIGANAFSGCDFMEEIAFLGVPVEFGSDAFNYGTGNGKPKVIIPCVKDWAQAQFGNASANPMYKAESVWVDDVQLHNMVVNVPEKVMGGNSFAGAKIEKARITADSIGRNVLSESSITALCIDTKAIGENAFAQCASLKAVYSMTAEPPSAPDNVFTNYEGVTLYVPVGARSAYENAETCWWRFLDVVETDFADVDELFKADSKKIDLRISDAGFATLMLPYEAALPEGVKAYSASQAGETLANGCRVLTLEEADALQANTPYIIEGTPGTYTFSGAVTNTQDTYTNGWLTGTFVGTLAQAGTYVLQNNNGITGFYRVAAGKEPQVGANRAWLSVPAEEGATAEVTAFVFGDDSATGIEGVDASDRRVDVYTLEGVRVRTDVRMSEALKALPRGVYVVNGTKKAVK